MTEGRQRIKIADACNWRENTGNTGPFAAPPTRYIDSSGYTHCPVDYLKCLDAMHEAVRTLSDSQRTLFRYHLSGIWQRDYNSTHGLYPPHDDSVNATARQRAEAFLRTIGEWED